MPRLLLPEVPLHITQRGINKGAIFLDDEDRHLYRRLMHQAFERQQVALHAFVLMDNHVHLLVTAPTSHQLSEAMRHLGQCYVRAFNLKYRRCGSLWQGRFKSCLVQPDRYLLNVMRYIELNPVRAAMVRQPEDHRWSSVHTHLARASDPLVTPHPLYLALGSDQTERARHYRTWLEVGIAPDELAELRNYARQERALGDECFQRMVQMTLGRPATIRPRGRPKHDE
jgi:putative transposase